MNTTTNNTANDVNNSNTLQGDTRPNSEPQRPTKIIVRTKISMVTRGQSDETANALFFDTISECPHTDQTTHTHDLKKGFSRSLQAQEKGLMASLPLDLALAYSDISGLKFDTPNLADAKARWLHKAFMLTLKCEYKLTFELVPANVEYAGTTNPFEWWSCKEMQLVTDLDLPERLILRMENAAQSLVKEIREEQKAKSNAIEWANME